MFSFSLPLEDLFFVNHSMTHFREVPRSSFSPSIYCSSCSPCNVSCSLRGVTLVSLIVMPWAVLQSRDCPWGLGRFFPSLNTPVVYVDSCHQYLPSPHLPILFIVSPLLLNLQMFSRSISNFSRRAGAQMARQGQKFNRVPRNTRLFGGKHVYVTNLILEC